MKLTYDELADCAYIRYKDEPVARTKSLNDYIVFDFDENDMIVGVEVIDVSSYLKEKRMKRLTQRRENKLRNNVSTEILGNISFSNIAFGQ